MEQFIPPVGPQQETDSPKGIRFTLFITFAFTAILWLVWLYTFFAGVNLFTFGILPHQLQGLWGILISPFLHGDIWHLASNTLPFAVLLFVLLNAYKRLAIVVLVSVHILTGLLVWVFAPTYTSHIGISGIIYGLAGFLIGSGIFRKDNVSISIAIFVVLLYGGLFEGFVPQPGISWQSHLFGALVGFFLSYFFRNYQKRATFPKDWVNETDDERHFFDKN